VAGRDEARGQPPGGVTVQRRVADQEPVPQHPVGHVHQHLQVRLLGELSPRPRALQQPAQRRAPLRGEAREHPRDVLVPLGGRRELAQRAGDARIVQPGEAIGQEAGQVRLQRPGVARGDDHLGTARHRVGGDGPLGRPPAVDGLAAHPGGAGDRVDGEAVDALRPEQVERGVEDRGARRLVPPPTGVRPPARVVTGVRPAARAVAESALQVFRWLISAR